jgi:hypothetical protein
MERQDETLSFILSFVSFNHTLNAANVFFFFGQVFFEFHLLYYQTQGLRAVFFTLWITMIFIF